MVLRVFLAVACVVVIAACSAQAPVSSSGLPSFTVSPTEEASPTAAPAAIEGVWVRIQDCASHSRAFEDAGLSELQLDWVTGNWVPEGTEPDPADPCKGSRPPEEHSHFFTDTGEFGSSDAHGAQVDDGDYVLVDDDTLSFPSHAAEFGFDGEVLVDFAIAGDSAVFEVKLPSECADGCAIAYAWALSAFFGADPWARVPPSR
jgi:hypothetical protein